MSNITTSSVSTVASLKDSVDTIHLKTVKKTTFYRWNGKKWLKTDRTVDITVDQVVAPPPPPAPSGWVTPIPSYPTPPPYSPSPPYAPSPMPTWGRIDVTSRQLPGLKTVID